jgi:uncharacterized protein YbjT (DUF2867 family)
MKTYVIMGATGHIGRRIAETLLERGHRVKAVGRNRTRLAPLVEKGAEAAVGTLSDAEFLTRALLDADAAFVMIPPDMHTETVWATQTRIGAAIAEAIRRSGVSYVVNLSSQGAHLSRGTGPIAGLHEQEERLNRIQGLNVVHLRASFFMENLENNLDLIRTQGINGTPLRADMKIPVIATRDIARVAVEYLTDLRFSGKVVRDLLGQRDLSMDEMTEILGKAIGKTDLRYVQFPYEAARLSMLGMGITPDVARVFMEMYEAFNEGRILKGIERTPENTTETPFEDFAVEFARLYHGEASPVEKPAPRHAARTHGHLWELLHRHRAAA